MLRVAKPAKEEGPLELLGVTLHAEPEPRPVGRRRTAPQKGYLRLAVNEAQAEQPELRSELRGREGEPVVHLRRHVLVLLPVSVHLPRVATLLVHRAEEQLDRLPEQEPPADGGRLVPRLPILVPLTGLRLVSVLWGGDPLLPTHRVAHRVRLHRQLPLLRLRVLPAPRRVV